MMRFRIENDRLRKKTWSHIIVITKRFIWRTESSISVSITERIFHLRWFWIKFTIQRLVLFNGIENNFIEFHRRRRNRTTIKLKSNGQWKISKFKQKHSSIDILLNREQILITNRINLFTAFACVRETFISLTWRRMSPGIGRFDDDITPDFTWLTVQG